MGLFGRGAEERERTLAPDTVRVWSLTDGRLEDVERPPTVWADALARYRSMSVPDRAAEVMAAVGPALAKSFEAATWKQGLSPRDVNGRDVLALLSFSARRPDKLSPEQWRAQYELNIALAEALNALVAARLLVNWDTSNGNEYAVSPDGGAALERGDVAAVVARRLPD